MELGKRLVAELGLEETNDTLARWMAHYVAELIAAVESASGRERAKLQCRCVEAILDLWAHRWKFPPDKRPFQSLEPIVETLEALSPEREQPFYRQAYWQGVPPEQESEIEKWLHMARVVDQTARMLIDRLLESATQIAVKKELPWALSAAKADNCEDDVRLTVVLTERLHERNELAKYRASVIQGRIDRLDTFTDMATFLRSEMQSELDQAIQDYERPED